jgi:hypothetical protein
MRAVTIREYGGTPAVAEIPTPGPGARHSPCDQSCRPCHTNPWTHEQSRAAGELDIVGQPDSSRRLSS